MKRKVAQAVEQFMKLEQKYKPLDPYFQQLFYLYRAFGRFMLGDHALAIEDYKMTQKFMKIDKHIKYNQ